MSTTSRYVSIGTAMALALTIGGTAFAQLVKDDQKCIDGYNNKLRLVGQQAGKDYRSCIKNAGKGTEPDPDGCVTADTPGKIAGKVTKVNELFLAGGKCDPVPAVIVQGAATGSNAMIDASQALVRDVFGDPISGVLSPPKPDAKCQDKAYQRAEQLFTEKLKIFRKCKKDGMKALTPITDEASLQATCAPLSGIPDPDGKIQGKRQKLYDDVDASCVALDLATLFQGDCSNSADTTALGICIEERVECRVCEALNAADGLNIDCDLFDNGLADGSCIPMHKCVLDTVPATDSEIRIYIAALGGIPLQFGMSGSVDIGADPDNDATNCIVQNIDPINIPSIGNVCITPSTTACALGTRECAGGSPLGIDVQSDGNTGACAGEAACDASCIAFCGGASNVMSGGCTGFCNAGAFGACTSDAMCLPNDGSCNGPDPVLPAQANICQCSCVNVAAGGASGAGDVQCNLGASLVVETAPPCDGTDVSIQVGNSCIPLSTQSSTGLITDANFIGGSTVPSIGAVPQTGNALACATVDASTTTGMVNVGQVNFFGSSLGDLAVLLKTTCQ